MAEDIDNPRVDRRDLLATLGVLGSGALAGCPVSRASTTVESREIAFSERSSEVGFEYSPRQDWIGNGHSGVYVADVDNDLWPEVLAVGGEKPVLFDNDGGTFTESDALPAIERQIIGALFFDHDNSGWEDLLLLAEDATPVFLENDEGEFSVQQAGFDTELVRPVGATAADYDRDGRVEVFVFQLIDQFDYAEAAALALIELTISLSLMYAYLRYEARQAGRTRGARPLARRSLLPDRLTPREVLPRLGLAAYAVVAGLVFLAPIASMVYASVSGPAGLTLDHFQFLVERQTTGAAFQVRPLPAVLNSLQFAAASLALALPMGVVVAVLTTRNYRGRSLVGAAAMAPLAVSGIVVGLGLLRGLVFGVEVGGHRIAIDGAAAIIAAHAVAGYPFVVRVVAPGMDRLDPSLVESARALGAPRVRALIDIELPLVWPAVVAGAAFAFAISIGEFTSTAVLASSTGQYTMPIAIQRFIGRRLGPATAMGVVLLAVTAVSFVCIEWLGGERDGL